MADPTQGRWQLIAELFDAALALPATEQAACLAQACAGDAERLRVASGPATGTNRWASLRSAPSNVCPVVQQRQRFDDAMSASRAGTGIAG